MEDSPIPWHLKPSFIWQFGWKQEGEAVQSHIINFPGSLRMETDLCQVEREGVRQWEQYRREDGAFVLKNFQREKGSVESRLWYKRLCPSFSSATDFLLSLVQAL